LTQLLEAALTYATRGWPVFPVQGIVDGRCSCKRDCSSPGKHPLVRRGLREATTNLDQVTEWWMRWPFANVAVVTGDIAVIDIDLPRALPSLDLIPELPRTVVSLTGGGGVHLYFNSVRELRNHVAHLPGLRDLPGVDLRGTGGYVVAPPSAHVTGHSYEWLDGTVAVAPAPGWLREQPRPEPVAVTPRSPPTESTPYGLAALRDEIEILLRTPVGRRNGQLNKSAFGVAQLVAGGELREDMARSALMATAIETGLELLEVQLTIESAFRAGTVRPRTGPSEES
jgi:hypothetical protein